MRQPIQLTIRLASRQAFILMALGSIAIGCDPSGKKSADIMADTPTMANANTTKTVANLPQPTAIQQNTIQQPTPPITTSKSPLPAISVPQSEDNEAIRRVAQAKVDTLVERPADYWGKLNLQADELLRLVVGEPYEIAKLDDSGTPIDIQVWRVPVIVDDVYRLLVTVRRVDGQLKAISIGAATLASELQTSERKQQSLGPIRSRTILRQYRDEADFVVYDGRPLDPSERAKYHVHPLRSATQAYKTQLDPYRSSEPKEPSRKLKISATDLVRIVRR